MDALWMIGGLILGAGVFAAGFYMGSAGTVHRLKRDVEDELEMLAHQRERIRGRERRAVASANGHPGETQEAGAADGEKPMSRAERKEKLRARAAQLYPQLVRTNPHVATNQQKQT